MRQHNPIYPAAKLFTPHKPTFFGRGHVLGSSYPVDLKYDDYVFPTAAHLYQYMKAIHAGCMETALTICKEDLTVAEVERLGRDMNIPPLQYDSWYGAGHKVAMTDVLRIKLEASKLVYKTLMATGEGLIAAMCPHDSYWGTGIYEHSPKRATLLEEMPMMDMSNNTLGQLWMFARDTLNNKDDYYNFYTPDNAFKKARYY